MPRHILSIVGARPQFVKAAMIAEAVRAYNGEGRSPAIRHTLVHTGQHYDQNLSDIFFAELPLPKPDHNLGVGSGSQGKQTGELLAQIEQVLVTKPADVVVVYGDTNSTLAGALAATKLHIPVAHVEAGLRSFNRQMPEEINRVVTDHISNLLFCPTEIAVRHLAKEGIFEGVFNSGDVMLDAALTFATLAQTRSEVLSRVDVRKGEYILFTMHRAGNTDFEEQIANSMHLLLQLRWPVVFPVHPRTRARMNSTAALAKLMKEVVSAAHLRVIDPVSYLDMLALEKNARLVLTDSGGVQKEAYFFGVPCITLRAETEWTETLEGGWNRLAECDTRRTLSAVESLWKGNGTRPVGRPNLSAFGDGRAAGQMVEHLTALI